MVDANQGWRMPGDLTPRWDLATALAFARELERLGRLLARGAAPDRGRRRAMRRCARAVGLRIAAGELVRSAAEARELVLRGGIDVVQTGRRARRGDRGRAPRRRARRAARARWWSPHTWSNGYGLLANLHAALAFSTCPYLEVPFDPPAWSAGAPRLAPSRHARDRRGRDDRRRPPARASASSPTSTRSSSTGSADADPRGRPPRARATRRSRRSSSSRRGTTRSSSESSRQASATRTCGSPTASSARDAGRWCMGHEGAGVVEAVGDGVTHVAPGDHVGFCIVPACRKCDECRAGRFNLCLPAGRERAAWSPARRHVAAVAFPTGRRSSTR